MLLVGPKPCTMPFQAFSCSAVLNPSSSFSSSTTGTPILIWASLRALGWPNVCRITGVFASAFGPAQPVLVERGGDHLFELHVAAGVDLRCLQLGENPGLAANQRDRLVEGRHLLAGELLVEPRAGVERLDLGEGEVVRQPRLARLAFDGLRADAIGKQLLDVRWSARGSRRAGRSGRRPWSRRDPARRNPRPSRSPACRPRACAPVHRPTRRDARRRVFFEYWAEALST